MLFRLIQRWIEPKSAARAESLGRRLGRLGFRVAKKHRNRTISNLRMALPELSEAERSRLAVAIFEHFGIVTADFMRSMKRSDEEFLATTEIEGFEHVRAALAEGKGVLMVGAHFGNFERIGPCFKAHGVPLFSVARKADDTGLEDLVTQMRKAEGMEVLTRGNAAGNMLRLLKQNHVVGALVDQNSKDIFVPFFGKPCGTVRGPAVLHLRTGAPLLMFFVPRIAPMRYRVIIGPPIQPEPGYDGPEAIMRAINTAIEEMVRKHPEQWLWLHDRWRSARRAGLFVEEAPA